MSTIMTKAFLDALLAQDEMESLVDNLFSVCSSENNKKYKTELILITSRYYEFENNKYQIHLGDRDVAARQIKAAFKKFISLLDLPEDDPTAKLPWIRKAPQRLWRELLRSPLRWTVLAFFVVIISVLLGQIKVRETVFTLDAKVNKMSIWPAQPWHIGSGYDQYVKQMDLEYVNKINLIPQLKSAAFASIYNGRIQLNDLPIQSGQRFFMERDKKELILGLSQGITNIALDVMGSNLNLPDLGIDTLLGNLNTGEESLQLTSSQAAKIWLSTCDTCAFNLPELLIDSLDLSYKSDSGLIKSSFLGGQLNTGGKTHELRAGEWVALKGLKKARLQILPDSGFLRLKIAGTASSFIPKSEGEYKSFNPTWMQYLLRKQSIWLFVAGAIFLTAAFMPFIYLSLKRSLIFNKL